MSLMRLVAANARLSGVQLALRLSWIPVDPATCSDRGADLRHERQVVAAPASSPEPYAWAVVVDVVGAHDLADAVMAVVGRALAFGPTVRGPAAAGDWAQADRAHLIKRDHRAAIGRGAAVSSKTRAALASYSGSGLAFQVRVR